MNAERHRDDQSHGTSLPYGTKAPATFPEGKGAFEGLDPAVAIVTDLNYGVTSQRLVADYDAKAVPASAV